MCQGLGDSAVIGMSLHFFRVCWLGCNVPRIKADYKVNSVSLHE